MKLFVCGGTGYVGSKLITMLINQGHEICCVKRKNSKIYNLPQHNIEYCTNDANSIENKFKTIQFDWVLNMACAYTPGSVLYNDILEANLKFPLQVLNIATNYGVKNFLTIGTGLPYNFNMYSFSKAKMTDFGKFYHDKHGINFYSLELEMLYGPNEPRNRFLPSVIDRLCKNENIPLTLGTQRRDIIYIDDVINAISFIINSIELKGFQIIPVGTGDAPQIREIVIYLHNILKSKSQLKFGSLPMRKGEPNCIADTQSLCELGFKAQYYWKEGLKKMLEEEKKI